MKEHQFDTEFFQKVKLNLKRQFDRLEAQYLM